MTIISDFWETPCMVWKTQIPVEDVPCNSPGFSLRGSDWRLYITFRKDSNGGVYSIFLLKGTQSEHFNNILHSGTAKERLSETFNVVTFIQEAERDSSPLFSLFKTVEYTTKEIWSYERDEILRSYHKVMKSNDLKIVCLFYSIPTTHSSSSRRQNSSDSSTSGYDLPDLKNLSLDLCNLFEDKTVSDVVLKCDGHSISAHKAILAARSDVFATRFSEETAGNDTVEVQDVDPDVLELLVRYMYTGKLPDPCQETVRRLYGAADKFAVRTLKRACFAWISRDLSEENCLEVLLLAANHADDDLKEVVVSYTATHLHLISAESWSIFKDEYPRLAVVVYDKRYSNDLSQQALCPSRQTKDRQ